MKSLSTPFDIWRNCGLKVLGNLPKITQWVSDRPRSATQMCFIVKSAFLASLSRVSVFSGKANWVLFKPEVKAGPGVLWDSYWCHRLYNEVDDIATGITGFIMRFMAQEEAQWLTEPFVMNKGRMSTSMPWTCNQTKRLKIKTYFLGINA